MEGFAYLLREKRGNLKGGEQYKPEDTDSRLAAINSAWLSCVEVLKDRKKSA